MLVRFCLSGFLYVGLSDKFCLRMGGMDRVGRKQVEEEGNDNE